MTPRNKPVTKVCEICEEYFDVPYCRREIAKFCSVECSGIGTAKRYDNERVKIDCKHCGEEFSMPQCHSDRRVYCSYECHAEAERGIVKPSTAEGNLVKQSDGYYLERAKFHPFAVAGYVFEHRLVVERWLNEADAHHPFLIRVDGKRYLRRDIVVHHINEIKDDNRLINVIPLTNEIHGSLHAALKILPKRLWDEVLEAVRVKAELPYIERELLHVEH